MQKNRKTKLFAIIGYPLTFTISPHLHNACFRYLEYNARYVSIKVKPKSLEDEVIKLKKSDIAGFNVTIPHKETIIPLLDALSCEAGIIGAVNTVKNIKGRFVGYNTDGEGFLRSLKDNRISLNYKSAVCIGAGGAARAVIWAAANEGAYRIVISNRTKEKADKIAGDFKKRFRRCVFEAVDFNAASLQKALKECDIVINTTSLGMRQSDRLPINPRWLRDGLVVCDIIYKDTALIKFAKKRGLVTINGLGMLVHQAALSFKLWTGIKAPLEIMRRAAMSTDRRCIW